MMRDWLNASSRPTKLTSEASFCSPMKSEQRRHDPADGLRGYDVTSTLHVGQSEGARRRGLAPMHVFHPGPEDLRHVRSVDEHQREDAQLEAGQAGEHGQSGDGQTEGDQVDDDDCRRPRNRST